MNKVVSLDLETSGFSPEKNEVLEIGAVAYFPSTGERRLFNVLILNKKPIHPKVSEIHGLTREVLVESGAISLEEALTQFVVFCEEDCSRIRLVGHNIEAFDLRFLKFHSTRVGVSLPHFYSIHDTYITERNWAKRRPSRSGLSLKLKDCCTRRHIRVRGRTHRALYDAYLAFRLYQKQ